MEKNFSVEDNVATIKLNKEIYSKEVITQTSYVMLDDLYFLIDVEDNYFVVYIKPKKESENIENFINSFFDELVESQAYIDQLKRTSEIRQTILERALLTQQVKEDKEE